MFCPNCGTQLEDGGKFCPTCGTNLTDRQGQSAQDAPTTKSPPHPKALLPIALACAAVVLAAVIGAHVLAPRGESGGTDHVEPAAPSESPTSDATVEEQVAALERPLLLALAQDGDSPAFTPAVPSYEVESGLANVINASDVYLNDEERSIIERYGFVVDATYGNDEFYEVYESNRYDLTPSFVTVDSLMHTYHLYFQHLQKNTERTKLSDEVRKMSQSLLATSVEQLNVLAGTEWEEAARRNVAFFSVGAALQDPQTAVPNDVRDVVEEELANIRSASGIGASPITANQEDYSQYTVRGYYAGDDVLEAYFRTMMWYGRINFTQANEDLDRSAALMTMALEGDALSSWQAVYAVTSFFAGASDDCGYYEYRPLLDAAYGEGVSVGDLPGNDDAWQRFHQLTNTMPAPQINSVPLAPTDDPEQSRTDAEKGFRLMGQRFTLDEMVFQQLVYPQVKKADDGSARMMPDALDVPAALGSDAAYQILDAQGATRYPNYDDNLSSLRALLADETAPRWSASLYSQWLYTLNPLLREKGEGYPTFMRSPQWARKSLQSYLGSFTELKHDTVLYSKQIMVEMGGGPLEERDDRGYVEPEPEVFGRLANLSAATADGLASYGLLPEADAQNLSLLRELAERLSNIARHELTGEDVTDDDYELIRSYGGQLEHFWQEVYKDETDQTSFTSRDFPSALVVDVATNGDAGTVLELGTGQAMRIYVIVPIDGTLRIARGSVFTFYEFEQPLSDRLTDNSWRQMMGIELDDDGAYHEPEQQLEDWTNDFSVERY